MTTRTTPSPIEILADAALRDAAEAGAAVLAFDEALSTLLFADAAGRALLFAAGSATALRQIRSAAGSLAASGRATILLRQAGLAGSRVVRAEIALRPATTPFALVSIEGLGQPSEPEALVEAAGLVEKAVAVFAEGAERFATPAFAERTVADLADRIARFAAGPEAIAVEDDGAAKLTLARLPFGRVLALAEASERPAEEIFEAPAAEPPAPAPSAPASAGFASFSVKRAKIGAPRPGMSMSALLQRWHARGPETEGAESATSEAPADIAPQDSAGAEAGEAEAVRAAEPGTPGDAVTAQLAESELDADIEDAPSAEPGQPMAGSDAAKNDTADAPLAAGEDAAGDRPPALAEAPVLEDEGERLGEVEPEAGEAGSDGAEAAAAERPALAGAKAASEEAARMAPAFVPRFDVPPVRFVWQIDRDGAFRFLSPDFAGAVGPNAADVVARAFSTVARVFGFDETREIARLLERRDTWSGRTILWPVQGSDRKVPVDLAALPVYGRDRSFDGFRGFGIVRLNESVADEEGLGLLLTSGPAPAETPAPDTATDETPPEAEAPREKPFLRRFEAESFGRRAEPPAQPEPEGEADEAQKVIRLEERRRPREGALSSAEEAAFRAIGAKLGVRSEAESPGALRFEETAQPAEEPAPAAPPEPKSEAHSGEAPRAAEPGTTTPEPEPASLAEPDGIEPALAALSEKLAQAEAEADRRLAARREGAKGALAGKTAPEESTTPTALEAAAPLIAPATAPGSSPSAPDAPSEPETADVDGIDALPPVETAPEAAEPLFPPLGAPDAVPLAMAGEPVAEIDRAPEAAEAEPDPAPLRFFEDEDEAEPPLDLAVFERLFAGLPLAVLVQVRETTVYTNAAFGLLTGHGNAEAVEAAGGLDALVLDRQGEGTLALLRADGEVVEVHGHMQRIAEGGRSALLMSFSPVADEAAATGPALDDLRQEVEELQAVLDTATDGVVLLDMAGSIRAMNGSAHALFGLGADEAFGRHVSTLFAEESRKTTADYLDMLRDDGIGGILNDGREVVGRVAQGGLIPLFITIGRLSGERGWCVVIRDIAHWKRIEEDLVNARRQAEAASLHKSRFLANISHELRTPLNAIIGFADVMSSECFGPIGNERYLEYLGDIKRSGHHVLDLVNDLLDISKIEAGKIELSFEAVSLNEVISEAVSLMQPQANRERVIVRSNLPSSVPPVVADRRTMRQIALNLLTNAIKFTPAGGQIIASTTYSAEGEVLLRFRDSGIGMTEREIELALTPFQQVHAPSANRGEGTGLGLPLTKAMVEANRASFSILSTPGEGTLVEIVFPAPRVLAD